MNEQPVPRLSVGLEADPSNLLRRVERLVGAFLGDDQAPPDRLKFAADVIDALRSARTAPHSLPQNRVGEEFEAQQRWLGEHPEQVSAYVSMLIDYLTVDGARGESTTPKVARELMVTAALALVGDNPPNRLRILDLACGTGCLLMELKDSFARKGIETEIYGSDINPSAVRLAESVTKLRNSSAVLQVVDALARDPFPDLAFDMVVSDLPLGLRVNGDRLGQREGFVAERLTNDGTLLLVEAMLRKLRPREDGGGKAITLVTPGALFSGLHSNWRQALSERDWLRAVVEQPSGLRRDTGIATPLLAFDNAKPRGWKDKVQFVDLRGHYTDVSRRERRVTAEGLELLTRALRKPKPLSIARTVGVERLGFLTVRIRLKDSASYTRRLPASEDPEEWFRNRYGSEHKLSIEVVKGIQISWAPGLVFGSSGRATSTTDPRKPMWALLDSAADHRSLKRNGRGERLPQACIVIWGNGQAATKSEDLSEIPRGPFAAVTTLETVDRDYLVMWLNSPDGFAALRDAVERNRSLGGSATGVLHMVEILDELLVPVPHIDRQRGIATGIAATHSLREEARRLERDIWADPSAVRAVTSRVSRFITRDDDVDGWVETLPYPLAASLWAYRAQRSQPQQAARQLRLFFEATAEFLAAYLISAMRSDPSLWHENLPGLHSAMLPAGMSFRKASFGTWRTTIERFGAAFRSMLNSNDEGERQRARRALGNPHLATVRSIVGTEVLPPLLEANRIRNEEDAHGGAMSVRDYEELIERLEVQLSLLRAALGEGWAGLTLVRAGAARFRGTHYVNECEILMGAITPFAVEAKLSERPLIAGGLYLLTEDGTDVPFSRLIELGPEPNRTDTTAYFYNRLHGEGRVRRVAYQYADANATESTDADLARLVGELDGTSDEQ